MTKHLSLKRHGPLVIIIVLVLVISTIPGRSQLTGEVPHARQLTAVP